MLEYKLYVAQIRTLGFRHINNGGCIPGNEERIYLAAVGSDATCLRDLPFLSRSWHAKPGDLNFEDLNNYFLYFCILGQ